jgi:hypothetical protein
MLLKRKAELQQLAAKNFKVSASVRHRNQTTCSRVSQRLGFPQDVMQWRKMLCAVVKETQFSFAKA